jgi:hypothetical protein
MLRRNDRSLCRDETFGQIAVLEILLRAQDWEVEAGHLDTRHFMSGSRCTSCIGVGESMTEAITCGIEMALDNS